MTISPKKSTTPRGLTTWVISKCFVVSSNSCERLINFIHNQHLSRYALRKCADTLLDHRWPVSSPFLRPLARRRVYQWAWPVSDLQLPTFLAGIKLYCLVTEAYVCVNNLPRVITWKQNSGDLNRDLLITCPTPWILQHHATHCNVLFYKQDNFEKILMPDLPTYLRFHFHENSPPSHISAIAAVWCASWEFPAVSI